MLRLIQLICLPFLIVAHPAVGQQICKDDPLTIAPSTAHLTVNTSDETVSDNKTNLMWKMCLEGLSGTDCSVNTANTLTWEAALARPKDINAGAGFADHNDWRLPNIKELQSIIEEQCYQPAMNRSAFKGMTDATQVDAWTASPTSTSLASGEDKSWSIDLADGKLNFSTRTLSFHVLLVRDITQ